MTSASQAIRQAPRGLLWVAFFTIAISAIAFITRDQWTWLVSSDDVVREVPAARELTVESADERRFSIDTTRSTASFQVREKLAGVDRESVGTSDALAGDIIINFADPRQSTIGTIVVNVEVLDTGSALRDKRIRHDFLESSHFRFAEFSPTVIEGLPESIEHGVTYEVVIKGDLTVKDVTASETFTGTAMIDGDELTATMTADILMSTYGVGPINIAGLAHTANKMVLGLELTAVDTTDQVLIAPIETAGSKIGFDPAAPGGFEANVLPVLAANCARCHNEGGPGFSTWSLETAADAAEIAADLALITTSRYMPPWPASTDSVAFEQNWALADHEIGAIVEWVAAGGALDVDPATPIAAPTAQLATIDRDIVTASARPYVGSLDQPDDYRCLINDPELTETRWLRAYDFEPDRPEVVHHAVVFLATEAMREQAEQVDARDDAPGWECFTLTSLQETEEARVDQVLGWAPGRQPVIYEPGTGLKMEAGDFLIVQIHYHYDHETPPDQSRMVLDFAGQEEVDAAGGEFASIDSSRYLGPAEIPCSTEEDGPLCDRRASIAQVAEDYGVIAGFIPDFLLGACGQRASEYAGMTSGVASSTCDLPIEQEGRIVSVFGHLHEMGAAIRLTLNPDTPDETVLLDIPTWSFEWQLGYTPAEEILVDRNDTIRIECSWDRSLSHREEPRYIVWSEGTGDEMCYSAISTVAVD